MKRIAIQLAVMALLASGCSYTPDSIPRVYHTQHTIESMSHWKDYARDMVSNLKGLTGSVYITHSDNSQFSKTFAVLLRSELIENGYSVSSTPDRSLSVSWNMIPVQYDSSRDWRLKSFAGNSNHFTSEVMLNFSVYAGPTLIIDKADIFYVRNEDLPMYQDKNTEKTFRIMSR